MSRLSREQLSTAVGDLDWRFVLGRLRTCVRAGSLADAVDLAARIVAAAGDDADGRLDLEKLARTIATAMRMLDNVIDINFYTIPEARASNLKHRPVGLGVMGNTDALALLRLPVASVAQLVEQLTLNQLVVGSIPTRPTI